MFPLIEYVDQAREFRTGVTKQGQGIDADTLQNQSATAVNQMFSAAQAKIKLIARVLAETGIRDLFQLLHATIRKNETQANTVRLRNKWVQVDPRSWKTRDDMTINVGLGTGSREQQVAHLMTVLGLQKEAMMAPGQNIVGWKEIYNALEKLVERIGLKSVQPYFTDPRTTPAPPPQPDPKQAEIQAKQQAEMAKMQADAAHQKMKTEADQQLEQQKLAYQTQMEQTRFEFDKQLAILKAQLDERKANHDMAMKEHDHALKAQEAAKPPVAAIKVEHGAEQLTGPLAGIIGAFGEHMANTHAQMLEAQSKAHNQHMEGLKELAKQMSAPRQIIRGKDGRAIRSEPVTH